MKWYQNLFVGESVTDKVSKLKWKINHNKLTISVYIITFASNPDNLLDVIPARELLQKSYPKKDLRIIGLAGDYEEAIELVRQIVEETYLATGQTNVREYLKKGRVTKNDFASNT